MNNLRLMVLLAVIAMAVPVAAQDAGSESAPCSAVEHRQFDFWLGEWTVTDKDGKVLGRNRIDPILGGCALEENWTSAGGGSGTSHNIYDRTRKVWHQTWVDGSGTLLVLEGGLQDGSMVLEGTTTGPKGETRQRITWTPLPDGRVRQHWETAGADGGFKTAFEGYYAR